MSERFGMPLCSHASPRRTISSESPAQFPEVSPFASAAKYQSRASFGSFWTTVRKTSRAAGYFPA